MMKNAVEVRGPRRRPRRRTTVLRRPRPRRSAAGVTGLLGPSGCGKSTLMRCARRRPAGAPAARSTVFGEPAGQPAAARPDRLRHPGRQRVRRPHRRREPRASSPGCSASTATRSTAAIDGRRPRRPRATRWSAGSAAASAPGSASRSPCSASPDLLVLDEPTVGLDPVLRRDLWALFHRLADAGAAVLRLQPRDGRGRALRPAAADARGPDHRRRHARRRSASAPAPPTSRRRSSRSSRAGGARHEPADHRSPSPAGCSPSCAATTARWRCCWCCPCLLITLLWWMFDDLPGDVFDRLGPALLAMFPFIVMFLVTSVTTLRERSQRHPRAAAGDADGQARLPARLRPRVRRWSPPSSRRSRSRVSVGLLGLDVAGPVWLLTVVAVVDAVLGTRARAVRLRVRADRVPGGAVHAGVRDPADPAVRAVRRRATQLPPCSRRSATCCRCPTPSTRCST